MVDKFFFFRHKKIAFFCGKALDKNRADVIFFKELLKKCAFEFTGKSNKEKIGTMRCYGHYDRLRENCGKCEYAAYCRDAGDIPLLADGSLKASALNENRCSGEAVSIPAEEEDLPVPRQDSFSRADMLEMICFLLALDDTTLEYLEKKIRIPTLHFADLARDRGISRQAVHKFIRQKCERIPELSGMLKTRKQLNKQPKTTFMEEICRIRRRMQIRRSKISEHSYSFLKNWSCSNRSLDLSKMSILKGSSIWRAD